jgi:hypothetical protein
MLKDLKGKALYDLNMEEFVGLFCPHCKDCGICAKDPKTVNICMQLIENGVWDSLFCKRQGN